MPSSERVPQPVQRGGIGFADRVARMVAAVAHEGAPRRPDIAHHPVIAREDPGIEQRVAVAPRKVDGRAVERQEIGPEARSDGPCRAARRLRAAPAAAKL